MPSAGDSPDRVLRALALGREETAETLFIELCRGSSALRRWLWEDFAKDANTRAAFARALRSKRPARLANLTGELETWQSERARLRARFPAAVFGGLSWAQLESLIARHRAGRVDLAAFALAQAWRDRADPRLLRAAAEFLDAVLIDGDVRRLAQLAAAARATSRLRDRSQRRALLGPTDWWKLQLLLFILRHPQPSYRTRDLRTHLADLGLAVSPKEIRRFCARHGIRRDMRAGRPRTNSRRPAHHG